MHFMSFTGYNLGKKSLNHFEPCFLIFPKGIIPPCYFREVVVRFKKKCETDLKNILGCLASSAGRVCES